jgi:hypothetical protein
MIFVTNFTLNFYKPLAFLKLLWANFAFFDIEVHIRKPFLIHPSNLLIYLLNFNYYLYSCKYMTNIFKLWRLSLPKNNSPLNLQTATHLYLFKDSFAKWYDTVKVQSNTRSLFFICEYFYQFGYYSYLIMVGFDGVRK